MGEKEIKPATPGTGPQIATTTPPQQEWHTQVRPGTGTSKPGDDPNRPVTPPRGGGSSGGGHASGHVEFMDDGYKMGRDENGTTWLQHPDGGRATWDPSSETWSRDDGGKVTEDWTGGHRPTDFGPKR